MIMVFKISKYISIILLLSLLSCSKARIEKPITEATNNNTEDIIELIKFVSLNNYFNSKIRNPEIFNVNTSCFLKTSLNTTLANSKQIFSTLTGDTIDYPYFVSINEFYKIKDIIYTNHQATYNSNFFTVFGVFNIEISKNNYPLKVALGKHYSFYFYNHTTEYASSNQTPVYENINNEWSLGNNLFTGDSTGVNGQLDITGWLIFCKETQFPTTNYIKLKFTSNKYDLTNVGIYLVFSDKYTFTRVENLESIDLPVGEQAKLVAFGITNEGQLYSYSKIITIGEQTSYDINLSKTTDNNLNILLDSL
jgi:hypothetical protein